MTGRLKSGLLATFLCFAAVASASARNIEPMPIPGVKKVSIDMKNLPPRTVMELRPEHVPLLVDGVDQADGVAVVHLLTPGWGGVWTRLTATAMLHRPNAHATIRGNSARHIASSCPATRSVMTTSAPASRSASAHRFALSRKKGSSVPATR